jgi:hypothetical protein
MRTRHAHPWVRRIERDQEIEAWQCPHCLVTRQRRRSLTKRYRTDGSWAYFDVDGVHLGKRAPVCIHIVIGGHVVAVSPEPEAP